MILLIEVFNITKKLVLKKKLIVVNKEELENIREDSIEEIHITTKIGMDFLDTTLLVIILIEFTELIQLSFTLFKSANFLIHFIFFNYLFVFFILLLLILSK